MSGVEVVPGTQVQMRVLKQYSHYNVGDLIAVEFYAGRELAAKRLAQPLQLLVPKQADAAAEEPIPQRQPGNIVRK